MPHETGSTTPRPATGTGRHATGRHATGRHAGDPDEGVDHAERAAMRLAPRLAHLEQAVAMVLDGRSGVAELLGAIGAVHTMPATWPDRSRPPGRDASNGWYAALRRALSPTLAWDLVRATDQLLGPYRGPDAEAPDRTRGRAGQAEPPGLGLILLHVRSLVHGVAELPVHAASGLHAAHLRRHLATHTALTAPVADAWVQREADPVVRAHLLFRVSASEAQLEAWVQLLTATTGRWTPDSPGAWRGRAEGPGVDPSDTLDLGAPIGTVQAQGALEQLARRPDLSDPAAGRLALVLHEHQRVAVLTGRPGAALWALEQLDAARATPRLCVRLLERAFDQGAVPVDRAARVLVRYATYLDAPWGERLLARLATEADVRVLWTPQERAVLVAAAPRDRRLQLLSLLGQTPARPAGHAAPSAAPPAGSGEG